VGTLVRTREGLLDSFLNADRIFAFLLSIGMKPFVELSFMPEALASGPTTVFKYRGNVTPPRRYGHWAAFIKRLVAHWVDRYGIREVADWFFEVWNEPNLRAFWTEPGTSISAYRDGSHQRGGSALRGRPLDSTTADRRVFIHSAKPGAAVDFVSTHHYPTDALYAADPLWNETADTETQLARSRRSILRQWAQDTRRRARGRPLYYTEWNTSSNPRDPLHDEPYAAAFVAKTLLEASGLAEGYSFWTFSDIFEEHYFPSVPFHGGFGLMTLHGIPKPTYRAFELAHRLGDSDCRRGLHHTVDAGCARVSTTVKSSR
jgi:xylan 1,4-beta-xylosidase